MGHVGSKARSCGQVLKKKKKLYALAITFMV